MILTVACLARRGCADGRTTISTSRPRRSSVLTSRSIEKPRSLPDSNSESCDAASCTTTAASAWESPFSVTRRRISRANGSFGMTCAWRDSFDTRVRRRFATTAPPCNWPRDEPGCRNEASSSTGQKVSAIARLLKGSNDLAARSESGQRFGRCCLSWRSSV
jgi:hypothetical protein